ncbi:MAG: hypothetical protein ACO3PV_06710 [Pseudohongiellaceae bacterium]
MKLFTQVTLLLLVLGGSAYGVLRWLAGAAAVPAQVQTPAQQAQALAAARGCLACHSLDGSAGIGPSWSGSWGAQRRFVDGSSARVDAAYLRESMLAPAARVVEGYDNVMLPTGFTDAEIELVTDLIRALGPSAVPTN